MIRKIQWDRFLKFVADGNSITDSAIATRIDRAAVYSRRDRDPEFAHALDQAMIATKVDAIQTIKRAWKNQWQAAGWWLERRHSDEFAIKSVPMINLTFKQNDKLKPIENEKLIEVTIGSEPANQIESK